MNLINSYYRWRKILTKLKKQEKRNDEFVMNSKHAFFEHYKDLCTFDYKQFLASKEFKIFSQHGEDGLLAFAFSQIGTTNKSFIEFGFGNGQECNCANLILNFGWNGLFIDGNKTGVQSAIKYYAKQIHNKRLKIEHAFITKENINDIFLKNGMSGEIDLLSIDIDGNDWWVWDSITVINPRIVIVEYNASLGFTASKSIVYDSSFYRFDIHKSGFYHGASLKALERLGTRKGYNFVGCSSDGLNALFVRQDINLRKLEVTTSEEASYPHNKRIKSYSQEEQLALIKHLPFEIID